MSKRSARSHSVDVGLEHSLEEVITSGLECPRRNASLSPRPAGCWDDAASTHSFCVRGKTYLEDKRKIPAGAALATLVAADTFRVNAPGKTRVNHMAATGLCRMRVEELTAGNSDFLFIVSIQVPGSPYLYMVLYWLLPASKVEGGNGGFYGLFRKYAGAGRGIDESSSSEDGGGSEPPPPATGYSFQDKRFKLIPRVVEGPWVVRKAVGTVPVLLGMRVKQHYSQTDRYIETNIEVGSSSVAAKIVSMCRGYSSKLKVELGIVLEGVEADELPEQMLGAIRLSNYDVEQNAVDLFTT